MHFVLIEISKTVYSSQVFHFTHSTSTMHCLIDTYKYTLHDLWLIKSALSPPLNPLFTTATQNICGKWACNLPHGSAVCRALALSHDDALGDATWGGNKTPSMGWGVSEHITASAPGAQTFECVSSQMKWGAEPQPAAAVLYWKVTGHQLLACGFVLNTNAPPTHTHTSKMHTWQEGHRPECWPLPWPSENERPQQWQLHELPTPN